MSFEILKKEVNAGTFRNLYLFYGPEDFLLKKYTNQIEKAVVNKDFADMNLSVLDGKLDQQKLMDICQTLPFLSDKRFVIVRDSGLFKPEKTVKDEEKKKKKPKDMMVDFLSKVPSHLCLIFCESDIDKRLKVLDAVKKNGLIVEFGYQKPQDLAKWIMMELKGQNIIIKSEDASLIVEFSEPGMTYIHSQVQKLIAFGINKGKIERADIENVCTKSIKAKIFDLTDAISDRDVRKSLMLLNDMIELKEPVTKLFFMIAKQFRNILSAKTLLDNGLSRASLAGKMAVHPFVADKLFKYSGLFSLNELKDAVIESYNMDLANKNGLMDDRIAAEILIAKFAGKSR